MPQGGQPKNHQRNKLIFFILVSLVSFYLLWKIFQPFLILLTTAIIFAVLLTPFHRYLTKLTGHHPRVSALFVVVLTFLLAGLPLSVIVAYLTVQIQEAVTWFGSNSLNWDQILSSPWLSLIPLDIKHALSDLDVAYIVKSLGEFFAKNVSVIVASTSQYLALTFLFFVSLYYFLAERGYIYSKALLLSPLSHRVDSSLIRRLTVTIRAVMWGNVVVGIIQGVLAGIGFIIFGVPGAAIWSLLTILAAQVPMIGTGITVFPAAFYLFATGHPYAALGLLVWGMLLVGTVDNFIKPMMVSGKIQLHSLLILFSMIGGLQYFGPVGFILGPAVLAVSMAFLEMYEAGVLEGGVKL